MSNGWSGPTWGQWSSMVNDAEYVTTIANENAHAAHSWKNYAEKIERELVEVWNVYRDSRGNTGGQKRIKEAALEEIKRLDPGSNLLDTAVRQKLFDAGYNDTVKDIPQKK